MAALILAFVTNGCSLLTIKSPEIPLTSREQEARLLTRDYAAHFVTTLSGLVDDASNHDGKSAAKTAGLRVKLGAVTEITRASTGLSPTASLLDTWAFSIQLRDYLDTGAGATVFGDAQPVVRVGVTELAQEAQALARKVSGDDYARFDVFVKSYAARNPLLSADMARPSVLSEWLEQAQDRGVLRTVGTVAQALGDVSDRLRIYGERVPTLGLWQAELALDRAGIDDAAYRDALRNLDGRMAQISKLAAASPELARQAIAEFHASVGRLDATWAETLRALRAERQALALDIATERESLAAAVDAQRAKLTADASRIAAEAVATSWRELRKLVREALLLALLGVVVVLGLPFTAGYLVGRRGGSPQGSKP